MGEFGGGFDGSRGLAGFVEEGVGVGYSREIVEFVGIEALCVGGSVGFGSVWVRNSTLALFRLLLVISMFVLLL